MSKTIDNDRSYKALSSFYDALASDYDAMTKFEKRLLKEESIFNFIVQKYNIQSALDAGCGTGLHSLLLARLGVSVTAVDISTKMHRHLRRHANIMHLKVNIVKSELQNLDRTINQQFDAIFCLGNTLAHISTKRELRNVLKIFSSLLKPNGMLITQTLNYNRILSSHEKIQNVNEVKDKTIIRFYEYRGKYIRFNILTLTKNRMGLNYNLKTILLRPILKEELIQLLYKAGFGTLKTFGGTALQKFQAKKSQDLVVIAKKQRKY